MSKLFDVVVGFCEDSRNQKFVEYVKSRDWNEETIKKWRLGFFPNERMLELKFRAAENGISDRELFENYICRSNGSTMLGDRIIFPIWSEWNPSPIAVTGRVLDSNIKPKYFNTDFDKGKILFGLNFAHEMMEEKNGVYIFEGNADVITAHQHGIKNSVCCMGTALTVDHLTLVSQHAENAVLLFDNDDGGRRALASFNKKNPDNEGLNIFRCFLEGAKDADEFLRKFGAEEFSRFVKEKRKDTNLQNALRKFAG
jgi:DNA primase